MTAFLIGRYPIIRRLRKNSSVLSNNCRQGSRRIFAFSFVIIIRKAFIRKITFRQNSSYNLNDHNSNPIIQLFITLQKSSSKHLQIQKRQRNQSFLPLQYYEQYQKGWDYLVTNDLASIPHRLP